jgi:D-amino-acid oxidase
MINQSEKVTVIGCGVSGLCTGIRLLEAGFRVNMIAKELPPLTTSDTAAAIWYPYRCFPEEKALKWGRETLEECYRLAGNKAAGVSIVTFTEYLPGNTPDPWWRSAVKRFGRVQAEKLPAIYQDGFHFEVPFVDSSLHMPWLVKRFTGLGGSIQKGVIESFHQVSGTNIIVNCAGIGAARLSDDPKLYPVKGQSVRIKGSNDGGYYLDQHGKLALSYVLPRSGDIVLGGTAEEHEYSKHTQDETTENIIQKAKQLDHTLQVDEVIGVTAGLRPARSEVRLEAVQVGERIVIHNYGHGGAGFTLSWGCANEVVKLALS